MALDMPVHYSQYVFEVAGTRVCPLTHHSCFCDPAFVPCSGRDLFTRQAASVEDIGKAGQEARTMVDGLSEFVQVSRECTCVMRQSSRKQYPCSQQGQCAGHVVRQASTGG
jgi:hypothetical protein